MGRKNFVLLLLLVFLSGCAHYSISSRMLPQMKCGLSEQETENILKKKGLIEFQFVCDNKQYLIKSYDTKDTYKSYYFVYSEQGLEVIAEKHRNNLCSQCTELPLSVESNGQKCLRILLNQWRNENMLQQAYNYSEVDKEKKEQKTGEIAEIAAFSPLWIPALPLVLLIGSPAAGDKEIDKIISRVQSLNFGMPAQDVFDELGNPPEHMMFRSNDDNFLMCGIPYKIMWGHRLPAVALGFENGRLIWVDYTPAWACSDFLGEAECDVHGDCY